MLYVNENHWLFKLMFLNMKPGFLIFSSCFPTFTVYLSSLFYDNIYFEFICWRLKRFRTNFDYIKDIEKSIYIQ